MAVVSMQILLVAPVSAAPFADPLETPARISAKAQSSRLMAVVGAGERLVAVGAGGHILISDDQGKIWQQVPVPVSSDLVAVRFVTPEKGWAVGHDGVVLHSADGGRSWVKQLDGFLAAKLMEASIAKLEASRNPDLDKLVAEARRFVEQGADKPFFDVLFLNEKEGFVVGAFNMVFRTRDGGNTWEPLPDRTDNSAGLHLYALAASAGELYLVGEKGLIRRWNREQERFVAISSPYKGSYFGVLAKESVILVFGMRGNAFRSADNGNTWKQLETSTSRGINSGVILSDGRIVLATDGGGMIVSDSKGDVFVRAKVEKPMRYFGLAPAGLDSIVLVGAAGVAVESLRKN